jgi:hypothetical protein
MRKAIMAAGAVVSALASLGERMISSAEMVAYRAQSPERARPVKRKERTQASCVGVKAWVNPERQAKVNRLTNWQRSQWARAGYKDDRLDEFAALVRMAPESMAILMAVGRI